MKNKKSDPAPARVRLFDDNGYGTPAYHDIMPTICRFAKRMASEMIARNIHHHDLHRAVDNEVQLTLVLSNIGRVGDPQKGDGSTVKQSLKKSGRKTFPIQKKTNPS